MINDGRSSLQKAAATCSSSSSLSIANSDSREVSNGKNRGTETSFQVGPPVARSPVAGGGDKIPAAYNISGTSYTIGGDGDEAAAAVFIGARKSRKKTTKNTQHFTIISPHDEQQHDNKYSAMDVDHRHEVNHGSMELEDTVDMSLENQQPSVPSTTKTQTFLQIGGFQEERKTDNFIDVASACDDDNDDRLIEQMEGVIDQGSKMPLIVLDGANVAYAYASVMSGKNDSSLEAASSMNSKNKVEPDVRGIQIATEFFLESGIRALVVLPQYWFRGNNNNNRSSTTTMTLTPQLEILSDLKAKGLVVASPPTDDDDAYALTISRREETRSRKPSRNGEGPGFVLSNDLFRDAQERDSPNGTLKEWLTKGRNSNVGPGRISYTFGDMGSMNDRGERVLDFVPNPRHPLVVWMESKSNESDHSYFS